MTTSRRDFLASSSVALLGVTHSPAIHVPSTAQYDVVIRGGTIFDGTGRDGREGDVALVNGRIAAVGQRLAGRGTDEIDAKSQAVAPGFVDIHSHGDGSLDDDPRAESLVRQGITTIVAGQDGSSRGTGDAPSESLGAWFTTLNKLQPAVNVAAMIGLGSVRESVVGEDDRKATRAELQRMVVLVERALADGACGASSGLEYTPGAFAPPDELIALCRPLAARALPYATHMRNEDDRLLDSIDESIAIARGARCPLQISHLKTQGPRNWSKLDAVFSKIESARKEGLNVAFDRYPYVAYQTGLTNLFPVWSRDGGIKAFFARLDDPSTSSRIHTEMLAKVDLIGGWDNVLIASVRAAEDKDAEGKRLGQLSKARGAAPYDVAVSLLRRSDGDVGMVGFAMSEDNLARILAHPLGMVCSDGGAYAIDGPTRRGSPHPRGLGTFPRVLGRYVRERKVLTLAQAINKMTALPASRVRLSDRGRIAVGKAGDIVVFDPSSVIDKATFESPFQYPEGISLVVVNGAIALRQGARVGVGHGRVVRPS